MKAEELMIGDWLFYKGQVAAFPFKVEQITKKKVGYHAEPCENRIHYLILSECDPIPLTPEILEKNGFTEIKGACPTFKIDIYGYLIKVTFPKENKETNKGNPFLVIDSRPSYYSSECLYVHELQHVLKLLGIKKEIEL